MSKKVLFSLWGGSFILCAGLGFIPGFSDTVGGGAQGVLTVLSVLFFLPPGLIVWNGAKTKDVHSLKLVRNLSALSLGLTLLVLILNMLAAVGSEILGNVLHGILIIVSTPMVLSGFWALSLFLWACLLLASGSMVKKM